jgi:hypothetical protein
MKAPLKKLLALNKTSIFRTFFVSLIFIAFFAFTLYILINSPA